MQSTRSLRQRLQETLQLQMLLLALLLLLEGLAVLVVQPVQQQQLVQ
jgi:hypothetical protein